MGVPARIILAADGAATQIVFARGNRAGSTVHTRWAIERGRDADDVRIGNELRSAATQGAQIRLSSYQVGYYYYKLP